MPSPYLPAENHFNHLNCYNNSSGRFEIVDRGIVNWLPAMLRAVD